MSLNVVALASGPVFDGRMTQTEGVSYYCDKSHMIAHMIAVIGPESVADYDTPGRVWETSPGGGFQIILADREHETHEYCGFCGDPVACPGAHERFGCTDTDCHAPDLNKR